MVLVFLALFTGSYQVFSTEIESLTPLRTRHKKSSSLPLSGQIKAGIGNIIYDEAKLKSTVRNKILERKNDLIPYFDSENDLKNYIDKLIDQGIKQELKRGNKFDLSNRGLIKFTGEIGRGIFGKIIDKKVANSEIWKNKIFSNFNKCIDEASSFDDASSECIDILKNETVLGIGQAIIAETTKAQFTEIDIKKSDQDYKVCINSKLKKEIQTEDVTKCVLDNIKTSIRSVSKIRIDQTIKSALNQSNLPQVKIEAISISIQRDILLSLDNCLNGIGKNKNDDFEAKFQVCGQETKSKAADHVIELSLRHHPQINSILKENFKSDIEREKIQDLIIEKQKENYRRLTDEGLNEDQIKDYITKDTTILIAESIVKKKLQDSNIPMRSELISQLRSCQENSEIEETCQNELSINVASLILDNKVKSIPSKELQVKLRQDLISQFKSCLSNTPDINCSEKLTQEATFKIPTTIGHLNIKEVLGVKIENPISLSKSDQLKLPHEFKTIDENFKLCISENVEHEPCIRKYFKELSYQIGKLAVESKVGGVIGKAEFDRHFRGPNNPILIYEKCLTEVEKNTQIKIENLSKNIENCSNTLKISSAKILREIFNKEVNPTGKISQEEEDLINSLLCLDLTGFKSEEFVRLTNNTKPILDKIVAQAELLLQYDSKRAAKDIDSLQEFLKKIAVRKELNDSQKAQEIEKFLTKQNILDLFLKATVRSEIQKQMSEIPSNKSEAKDRSSSFWIADPIKNYLSSKENIDQMFGKNWMQSEERKDLNKVISKLLISDIFKNGKVDQVELARRIKDKFILPQIAQSHGFKNVLTPHLVQNKISSLFPDSFPYTISWDQVRKTKRGQQAEDTILNDIIVPKLQGKSLNETKEAMKSVEGQVIKAITLYPLSSRNN